MRPRIVPPLVFALFLAACAAPGASTGPPSAASPAAGPTAASTTEPVELTILGAASLKGVLDQVKTGFESAHPGTTLVISTDSSAALATKIEQGAPADVFLSADKTNPEKLIEGGFASGRVVVFAGNELTIVVPTDDPAGIASAADLARAGVKVIAAGDEVPITKYADALVSNLAQEPGYPADFAAAYAANVVSREENVKAVIGKIELGEGDAGIVYVTDASASTKVKTVAVPDGANVRATYAGVVVAGSTNRDAAGAFMSWLLGSYGQAILTGFGFLPASACGCG